MKYIVVLCDGMADEPVAALGGRTPLQAAHTPNMDRLAALGTVGTVKTVPAGLQPGSDVANMAVMGYDPARYYTGRSSLEALSRGITLHPGDVSYRANLVTLSEEEPFSEKTLPDFSAGEVSNEDAAALIEALKPLVLPLELYKGISYRNLMIRRQGETGAILTPPHDIQGRKIADYLPRGSYGAELTALIERSYELLHDHPVNRARKAQGKLPANALWFWGEGTTPALPQFSQLRGKSGAVVCAVDLLKGIGTAAGMAVRVPETATGGMVTDYAAKAQAALEFLREGRDFVFIHIEAPDECGHHGDAEAKREAIAQIDKKIVGFLCRELADEPFRMLVLPDHPTPVRLKTHSSDPVPFLLYDSERPAQGVDAFWEQTAAQGLRLGSGPELMGLFLAE